MEVNGMRVRTATTDRTVFYLRVSLITHLLFHIFLQQNPHKPVVTCAGKKFFFGSAGENKFNNLVFPPEK